METQPPLTLWPDQHARAKTLAAKPGAVRIESDGTRADVAGFTTDARHTVAKAGAAWVCSCDFNTLTGLQCGHAVAARIYQARIPEVRVAGDSRQARYDAAQTQEVALFDALLSDLCGSIPEPGQHMGRPRLPLKDQAFVAIQKVYSQLSSRRARSLFVNAEGRGQLGRAPSFIAPSRFLNREDATPLLRDLVGRSAEPLAGLESHFAVDSTGFRITAFGPYCQDKHGQKRRHEYLKAHAISGARTNVVTDLIVTKNHGEGTGDCPNLPPLVEATAARFNVAEVSADKAYSARYNMEAIEAAGATPLIPFKVIATGRAQGSPAWKRAFHYFQAHRDDFDRAYHKRSNVESTFSAIKRKFGDTLKSRNHTAQVNELLCKAIAHNLTVVIRFAFEAGIDLGCLRTKSTV